jgi:hypothetical protein
MNGGGKIASFLSPLLCDHFICEIEEASRLVSGRPRGADGLGRRLPAIEVSGIEINGLNSTGSYSSSGGCCQSVCARQKIGSARRCGGLELPAK